MVSTKWIYLTAGLSIVLLALLMRFVVSEPATVVQARHLGMGHELGRDLVQTETGSLSASEDKKVLVGSGDLEQARQIYAANCIACHGVDGEGTTIAPALNTATLRLTNPEQLFTTIANGRSGTAMPAWQTSLSEAEITDLVALIRNWDDQALSFSEDTSDQSQNQQQYQGTHRSMMRHGMHRERGRRHHGFRW